MAFFAASIPPNLSPTGAEKYEAFVTQVSPPPPVPPLDVAPPPTPAPTNVHYANSHALAEAMSYSEAQLNNICTLVDQSVTWDASLACANATLNKIGDFLGGQATAQSAASGVLVRRFSPSLEPSFGEQSGSLVLWFSYSYISNLNAEGRNGMRV